MEFDRAVKPPVNKSTRPLTCAVMLPTHNRVDELRRTLSVLSRLEPPPDEILITADACTDRTKQFIRTSFPTARLIVNTTPRGATASRDAMAREARSDLLLSIDDDSYPLEPDAIARLREIFSQRPRLAVASFPQRSDEFPETLTATDFGSGHFAGSYVNCACAFRRQVLVGLGGHFGAFWNAYDEADFSVRCASAGWQVRFEPGITIRHHYSGVNRNELRVHQMHARNELWSVLMRCPAPQLFAVALFRAARQLGYAWERGLSWTVREPQWWLAFCRGLPRCLRERAPLPWRSYVEWMRLVRQPIASDDEWHARFGGGDALEERRK